MPHWRCNEASNGSTTELFTAHRCRRRCDAALDHGHRAAMQPRRRARAAMQPRRRRSCNEALADGSPCSDAALSGRFPVLHRSARLQLPMLRCSTLVVVPCAASLRSPAAPRAPMKRFPCCNGASSAPPRARRGASGAASRHSPAAMKHQRTNRAMLVLQWRVLQLPPELHVQCVDSGTVRLQHT